MPAVVVVAALVALTVGVAAVVLADELELVLSEEVDAVLVAALVEVAADVLEELVPVVSEVEVDVVGVVVEDALSAECCTP